MRIESDPKNCSPCDFLSEGRKGLRCDRMNRPIEDIKICTTGPMVRMPERGQEMANLMEKVTLYWRKQGERNGESGV